jgi:hypothetical protein
MTLRSSAASRNLFAALILRFVAACNLNLSFRDASISALPYLQCDLWQTTEPILMHPVGQCVVSF